MEDRYDTTQRRDGTNRKVDDATASKTMLATVAVERRDAPTAQDAYKMSESSIIIDGVGEQKVALQMDLKERTDYRRYKICKAMVGRRRSDDDECSKGRRGTMEGETDFVTPWEMSSVPATHQPRASQLEPQCGCTTERSSSFTSSN
jgi:hypothetical protein